jgi:hypothetical protein
MHAHAHARAYKLNFIKNSYRKCDVSAFDSSIFCQSKRESLLKISPGTRISALFLQNQSRLCSIFEKNYTQIIGRAECTHAHDDGRACRAFAASLTVSAVRMMTARVCALGRRAGVEATSASRCRAYPATIHALRSRQLCFRDELLES